MGDDLDLCLGSYRVDGSGRVILPLWWVYDCLFEYERDVKGNRGTDLDAERVAYLKSKVASTVKQSRDRLKPKLSEYSSRYACGCILKHE